MSSLLGTVYYIGYVGECMERFKVEGPVHSLLLHNERQVMAVVTQDMVLSQFSVNSEGQTTQTQKVVLCRGRGATRSTDRFEYTCSLQEPVSCLRRSRREMDVSYATF